MTAITLLGSLAALLTTLSFLPQAWACVRTGRTDGLNLPMYATFSSGVALWLVYGLVIRSAPVVAANAVTLVFALTILCLMLRNRRPNMRRKLQSRIIGE